MKKIERIKNQTIFERENEYAKRLRQKYSSRQRMSRCSKLSKSLKSESFKVNGEPDDPYEPDDSAIEETLWQRFVS